MTTLLFFKRLYAIYTPRKSRGTTQNQIVSHMKKLGGAKPLQRPETALNFYHADGAITRRTIPKKPHMENVKGFINPPASSLSYMSELVHYNYHDHYKVNEIVKEIKWRYHEDAQIKHLFAHHMLKRGYDEPFRVSFHKNAEDYNRLPSNYQQLLDFISTDAKNKTDLELLDLTLKLMLSNNIPLNDKLIANIYRVLPTKLKSEIFSSETSDEVKPLQTFNRIRKYIDLNIVENFNYETLTALNEAAVSEERYKEYLNLISHYVWITHSEIPQGLLKHVLQLIYEKNPALVFPFQARLTALTGNNLFPFTGTMCMDSLLEKVPSLTNSEKTFMGVLIYSDAAMRKFKRLVTKLLGTRAIEKDENFDSIVVNYLKNSRVFLAGGDLDSLLEKYNFLEPVKPKFETFKFDDNKTNGEIFNEILQIEEKIEKKAASDAFIERLISQGFNSFAIATSDYLAVNCDIDVRYDTRYKVLLKLTENITSENKPFIGLLYKALMLPPWTTEILVSQPELSNITNKYVTSTFIESFFSGLKWDEQPIFELSNNSSKFKYYSYLIDTALTPNELLNDGATTMFWKIHCSKSNWSPNHELIVDYFIKRGIFYNIFALLNSRNINVDKEKLFDALFKGYTIKDHFDFYSRNLIGLQILINYAKESGYLINEEVKKEIDESLSDLDQPNLNLIEKYEAKCKESLFWSRDIPNFHFVKNTNDFQSASRFFLVPLKK